MTDGQFVEALLESSNSRTVAVHIIGRHLNYRFRGEWEDVLQDALLNTWENRMRAIEPGPYFKGVVRIIAMRYRDRRIDRAEYCEVKDWMRATGGSQEEGESETRASERLRQLLAKVKLRHRIAFREWKNRGYRCETHAQSCEMQRMVRALFRAAGVYWTGGVQIKISERRDGVA